MSVFIDTFVICTCTALIILLSGFYTPGFEGDGIALTQNSLAAVAGDWGRSFISVILALFVFTAMLYNYYLGENSLRFIVGAPRKSLYIYRALVLALIFWGSVEDLSTVLAFADIPMTLLALVNLIAMASLFNVACAYWMITKSSVAQESKDRYSTQGNFSTWIWILWLGHRATMARRITLELSTETS